MRFLALPENNTWFIIWFWFSNRRNAQIPQEEQNIYWNLTWTENLKWLCIEGMVREWRVNKMIDSSLNKNMPGYSVVSDSNCRKMSNNKIKLLIFFRLVKAQEVFIKEIVAGDIKFIFLMIPLSQVILWDTLWSWLTWMCKPSPTAFEVFVK